MSYAWAMVAVTFFTQFLAMGFTFYAFGILQKPLQSEFSATLLEVNMLPFAMSWVGILVAPQVGRWIGFGSIRNIMTLGCVAMGLGFLLAAHATELWHVGVLFGSLLTFSLSTMGGVTTQALIVNWFEENRTMALGVSLMGISASGIVMPHVTTALVTADGWRHTFELFGWASLCAIPLVWLTVVSRPSERTKDAVVQASAGQTAPTPKPKSSFSTRKAFREPNLWIIAIVSGLAFMGTGAILTHVVAFATNAGFSDAQAASLMSMIAAGAMAGKIVFGWAATRIGEHRSLYIALIAQALGTTGLVIDLPFGMLLALMLPLGIGLGGVMPLGAALLARAFGPANFGPMMGLMTPILIPFQSIGAPAAAAIYDATGSYDGAWWGLLAVMLAALLLLTRLDVPSAEPDAANIST